MSKRCGKYTILTDNPPVLAGWGAVVSKKEGEGPLAEEFDKIFEDPKLGMSSWEAAESELLNNAVQYAISKAGVAASELQAIITGDLLDQCMSSTFGTVKYGAPHIGMFGACSTMALSMITAALLVDGGGFDCVAAATGSHFCSAERQFRFPLEYGGKRTPTSQWTVTGAGSVILKGQGQGPRVRTVSYGRVMDYDIKDANNMGAAMAPAAYDTIKNFLEDTCTAPDDYDMILTGDLGQVGTTLLRELLDRDGIDISSVHSDCGMMIYSKDDKDVGAGGSGCGCSASVLCSHILNRFKPDAACPLKRILFCATGALMSPTSSQQGNTIPAVAHIAEIVAG